MDSAYLDLAAPAKVNLSLEVLGLRADGYHDIDSIAVTLSLADRLRIERTDEPGIELSVSFPDLPVTHACRLAACPENIVTRAARRLQSLGPVARGARIHIEKDIPVGGGLGGGSADAAATLHALNRLWSLDLPDTDLAAIGAELGSDVPALLTGGAVRMQGRGERITPLAASPAASWWIVLINPGFCIDTGDIYRRWKRRLTFRAAAHKDIAFALERGDWGLASQSLHNGLQAPVFRKYPLLAILGDRLREAGVEAFLLCGSGATLFALARDREDALSIADSVGRSAGMPLWIRVVKMLPDGVIGSTRPFGGQGPGSSPGRAAT